MMPDKPNFIKSSLFLNEIGETPKQAPVTEKREKVVTFRKSNKLLNTTFKGYSVEYYVNVIGKLLQKSSTANSMGHNLQQDRNSSIDREKDLKKATSKNLIIENNETKFSIKQLLSKNDYQESYKKNFFEISEELNENDEEISIKTKREILQRKLLHYNSMTSSLSNSFPNKLQKLIYLTLTSDSRKILQNLNYPSETAQMLQHVMDIDKEELENENIISNSTIMYLCNNLINISDILSIKEKPSFNNKGDMSNTQQTIYENEDINDITIGNTNLEISRAADFTITKLEEEFDKETFAYFINFLKNCKDLKTKQKLENLLKMIKQTKSSNLIKNKLLKSLKEEYEKNLEQSNLSEPPEENSIELDNVSQFKTIENPFIDSLFNQDTQTFKKFTVDKSKITYAHKGWDTNSNQNKKYVVPNKNAKIFAKKTKPPQLKAGKKVSNQYWIGQSDIENPFEI